jgi:hypothetical protein
MKKHILSALLLFSFSITSFSQKFEKDELDLFTKTFIKNTSWECISEKQFIRASKKNRCYFDLKLTNAPGILYDKIKFFDSNGNYLTVKFSESSMTASCEGTGYDVHTIYAISDSIYEEIKKNKIDKIRIFGNGGYSEIQISNEVSKKIITSLSLVKSDVIEESLSLSLQH